MKINKLKYKVRYFTEFGSRETIIKDSELVKFIYKFKVLNIEAIIESEIQIT